MRALAAVLMVSLASTGCTPGLRKGFGIGFIAVGATSAIGGPTLCKAGCGADKTLGVSLGMVAAGALLVGVGASLLLVKSSDGDPSPSTDPQAKDPEPRFSPPPP